MPFCFNSGTFRWDKQKDISLLREVLSIEPYLEKAGRKEAGEKWTEVATSLNTQAGFKEFPRSQRSVRDQFNKLYADFTSKTRKEESESGGSPEDPTEVEVAGSWD